MSRTSDGRGDSLEQVAWVLTTQRQEKLPVNNYLLKHNGVTIISTIYIYIYIEREREIVTFVVFEKQTIEVFGR